LHVVFSGEFKSLGSGLAVLIQGLGDVAQKPTPLRDYHHNNYLALHDDF